MRILQVSAADVGGGAEAVAWRLCQAYRARGHASWLAVGRKFTREPGVYEIPNAGPSGPWGAAWDRIADALAPQAGRVRGADAARTLIRQRIAHPERLLDAWRGREAFTFPGTWRLLDLTPERPDVVHCHNLHAPGGYFDLRALGPLSAAVPVAMTLHDAWLLAGHCAHSFDCERWRTGCGECPYLSVYPAVRRDATAENWRRKQRIYAGSRLHVATPSAWLAAKVRASMLAPALADLRVIPNGVDLTLFRPAADRSAVRRALGLPEGAAVLLFAANGIRRNPFKDFQTLRAAIPRIADRLGGRELLFLAVGESGPPERFGGAEVRFVPFERDVGKVVRYYQAADLYVHPTRADTFPTTVIEALACGTPVIASDVGGVPEQIHSLERTSADSATGLIVPVGDAARLADGAVALLEDDALRARLAANAVGDARRRFDLERQVDTHLAWYEEIARGWRSPAQPGIGRPSQPVG